MTTRSSRLAAGANFGGTLTVLTVPAGETWLLKSVIVYNRNAAAQDVTVFAVDHVIGSQGNIIRAIALGAATRAEWFGWMVLQPGDIVSIINANAQVDYWVSGTRLLGVV